MVLAASTPKCIASRAVAEEIAEHLPTLVVRRKLDLELLQAAYGVMPVAWCDPSLHEPHRKDAQGRMQGRDPDDRPTAALALATCCQTGPRTGTSRWPACGGIASGESLDELADAGKLPG